MLIVLFFCMYVQVCNGPRNSIIIFSRCSCLLERSLSRFVVRSVICVEKLKKKNVRYCDTICYLKDYIYFLDSEKI